MKDSEINQINASGSLLNSIYWMKINGADWFGLIERRTKQLTAARQERKRNQLMAEAAEPAKSIEGVWAGGWFLPFIQKKTSFFFIPERIEGIKKIL